MAWKRQRVMYAQLCSGTTELATSLGYRLMIDTLSPDQRSRRMGLIRNKDTGPELLVRRLVWSMGFRYALHCTDLPGRPDLVFRKLGRLIFVHGCFWHRHPSSRCKMARLPKSRLEFWLPKLSANRLRDVRQQRLLKAQGWKILVVWECELGDTERLENKIRAFLGDSHARDRTIRGSRGTRNRH